MSKSAKLPEIKKEAFTKARESLGLSTKDLSGMACLSVRQIEQIENGEMSSFYGPQIKVTAAKKVAALIQLSEEDAFDYGDVAIPKAESKNVVEETKVADAPSAINLKADKKPEPVTKAEVKKEVKQDVKPEASKIVAAPASKTAAISSVDSAKPKNKNRFLLLGIAAAIVFSIVNLRPLFFPEAPKEEIVVIEAPAPAAPAADAPAEAKPAPATPEPVAAVAATAPVASTDCPAADSAAMNYKPDAPKKAGDLVYLQSKTAQTVCVIDASGKTQNKTLEPGVGVSVYGKPPFKVLTSGLSQVDMYFQGVKVRLGATTAKTINLEPAEIIQPLAPTDSQLR